MEISDEERARLKRYLIGELGEDDRQEIGERVLIDDQYFAQMEMMEDELIDDYLSGSLSPEEQYRFETHFLNPPSRREKLRFARALRRYVKAEAQVTTATRESELKPVISPSRSGAKPILPLVLKIAAAAAVILAGFGIYRLFVYESDLQRGRNLFKALYKSERPLRSRLSTLEWAPFVEVRSGEPTINDLESQSTGLH
jgi:hypothetical protein